jgi:hypothetical protein
MSNRLNPLTTASRCCVRGLSFSVEFGTIVAALKTIAVAFLGKFELTKYLVEKGADVNVKMDDNTPLLFPVAYSGNLKVVRRFNACCYCIA